MTMLTAQLASDSTKVIASQIETDDGPFLCPMCCERLVLRKGLIKTHHFAHYPNSDCSYGIGESEEHYRCKSEIYRGLLGVDYLSNCEMEKVLGKIRPDIYFESKRTGRRYGIEVQLSNLTVEKIIARTTEYNKLGVFVLWLPQFSHLLRLKKYSPSAWEKWLHTLYFGRVYYWVNWLSVIPVQFEDYMIHVPHTDWGGGYDKRSKRYRSPRLGESITIPDSFRGAIRRAWNDGPLPVPNCRIMTEIERSC